MVTANVNKEQQTMEVPADRCPMNIAMDKELQQKRRLMMLYTRYIKSKSFFHGDPKLFYKAYAKAYHSGNAEVLAAPLNFEQKQIITDFAIVYDDIDIASFIIKKGGILQHSWSKGENIFELSLKFASLEMAKMIASNNQHGFTLMHLACLRGDLDAVEQLVLKPDLVNAAVHSNFIDWPGFTPLHFALVYEHKHLFATLLDNGADISIEDADMLNPLQRALLRSDRKRNSNSTVDTICNMLLERNVFVINSRNLTLLHLACMMDNCCLVGKIADSKHMKAALNARISSTDPLWPNYAPLHIAAKLNKVLPIDVLLKNDADYTATIKDSKTALHLAFEYGHKEIVDLMLSYHSGKCNPSDGKLSHLDFACSRPDRLNKQTVEKFLKNGHHATDTAPLMAFKYGRATVIRTLVNNGCDISIIQKKSFQDLSNKSHKMINQLISWGVWKPEQYQSHDEEQSLIHVASSRGYAKVVRILLEHGVDPNGDKLIGKTPMYLGISARHVNIVKILLDHYADPSYNLKEEFNVFRKLVEPTNWLPDKKRKFYNQVIELMLKAGIGDCDLNEALYYSVLSVNRLSSEILLRHGADVNFLSSRMDLNVLIAEDDEEDYWSKRDLCKVFCEHITLLEAAKLYVNDTICDIFDNRLSNHYNFQYQWMILMNCERECQLLEQTKINKKISLYDILFKNIEQMACLVTDPHFVEIMSHESFHNNFTEYGYLLQAKFTAGLLRRAVMEPAQEALQNIVGMTIPYLCFTEISKYLNNRDLKNVTRAELIIE